MANSPKGKRYAQALFALAEESGATQEWLEEIERIRSVLEEATARLYFLSPRVRTQEKLEMVSTVTQETHPMLRNLIGLLVSRQGLGLLSEISDAYKRLLDENMGRVMASITTATLLSPTQRQRLSKSLGSALGKEVVVETQEDYEVIGGMVVKVDDRIIDGSVRARLSSLRKSLSRGA